MKLIITILIILKVKAKVYNKKSFKKMKDFLSVFLTSDACGQCHYTRGDGIINNGKIYMAHQYLKKMTQHSVVFNIHLYNMSANIRFIKEISKFSQPKKDIVRQELYFNKNGDAYTKIIISNKSKNTETKEYKIKDGEKTVKWLDFVEKKVPKKIENYIYFFPCFLFMTKQNWKNALSGKDELIAIPNSGLIKQSDDGSIGLEKSRESIGKRNSTPEAIITQILEGKLKFEPHIKSEKIAKENKKKYRAETVKNYKINAYDKDE